MRINTVLVPTPNRGATADIRVHGPGGAQITGKTACRPMFTFARALTETFGDGLGKRPFAPLVTPKPIGHSPPASA